MKKHFQFTFILLAAFLLNDQSLAADTLRLSQLQKEGVIYVSDYTDFLEVPTGTPVRKVNTGTFPVAEKAKVGSEYWYTAVLLNDLPDTQRVFLQFDASFERSEVFVFQGKAIQDTLLTGSYVPYSQRNLPTEFHKILLTFKPGESKKIISRSFGITNRPVSLKNFLFQSGLHYDINNDSLRNLSLPYLGLPCFFRVPCG